MRRVMRWMLVIAFLFSTFACVGDQAPPGNVPEEPVNKLPVNVVKIRTTGRIVAITDTRLVIECSVKETVETFELELEKPITKFKVGDKVVVWYTTKEDKSVLKEITRRGLKSSRTTMQQEKKAEPLIAPQRESVP